jgi:DNA-binding GntR family transcriptional regulator
MAKGKKPNSKPQYQKLAEWLMSEIQSGRYAVGERMPGEFELVEKHNVSRHTVRESLRVLEDLGLIDRHQGHGTVQITLRCTPLDPQWHRRRYDG